MIFRINRKSITAWYRKEDNQNSRCREIGKTKRKKNPIWKKSREKI